MNFAQQAGVPIITGSWSFKDQEFAEIDVDDAVLLCKCVLNAVANDELAQDEMIGVVHNAMHSKGFCTVTDEGGPEDTPNCHRLQDAIRIVDALCDYLSRGEKG
jgi:hypothetical protein